MEIKNFSLLRKVLLRLAIKNNESRKEQEMPRAVKGMEIKEARIEEIVAFKDMESLDKYVSRQKSKVLFDINFGFGIEAKSKWCETYSPTAIRYTAGKEMLIHICFPYNSILLSKKGILCNE